MKTLLENVQDYNDYTIFSTLFYTGMRKGELFALQKKDIDLDKGVIHITKSYINATINMYKNDHIKMYKINST